MRESDRDQGVISQRTEKKKIKKKKTLPGNRMHAISVDLPQNDLGATRGASWDSVETASAKKATATTGKSLESNMFCLL